MRGNGLDVAAPGRPPARYQRRRNGVLLPGWTPMSRMRLVVCVLLPFAAGYYLSYLFRSINALIAGDLVAELGLTAADLGLLTSVYFLLFAAVQLPCGVLLDRYGPRLIDSALLLVAAAGSLLFALADGVATLLVGRALIGLGVAVGLMAGLKAIVLWFPPERVALANGWYIMLGALGALSATGPAEAVVQALGWRGLFAALAVASAAVALLILLVVPERKSPTQTAASPRIGFLAIYLDPRFLRIAPLAALGVGTSFSLQGLWAAPWLADVAGLDRPAVVAHLTFMAAALAASALLLGAAAERLRRAGIPTELFLAAALTLSMAAQLALLLGLPVPSYVLFAVIAAAGAATVLSFAVLARYFPKEVAGRANAALGVLNMGTAFGLPKCLWPAQRRPQPLHVTRRSPSNTPSASSQQWPAEDALPGRGPPGRARPQPRAAGRCVPVVHPAGTQDRSPAPAGASDPCLRRKPRARAGGCPVLRPRPPCVVAANGPRSRAAAGLALRRLRFVRCPGAARLVARLDHSRHLRCGPRDRRRPTRRNPRLRGWASPALQALRHARWPRRGIAGLAGTQPARTA